VSIAALLRRYIPSPHSLLRLLSHVPTLVTNYILLTIQFCCVKFVNSIQLYSGTKSARREPKQEPPQEKYILQYLKVDSSRNIAWPWLFL